MEREDVRLNPRVVQLREHAQRLAANEVFDEARWAEQEADAMQDHITETRKQQLIAAFVQSKANLLKKKQAVLKALETREIEVMTEKYRKQRQSELPSEKRLAVLALKTESSLGPPPPGVNGRASASTKVWYGPAFRKIQRKRACTARPDSHTRS
jgi:hypothetical protein